MQNKSRGAATYLARLHNATVVMASIETRSRADRLDRVAT